MIRLCVCYTYGMANTTSTRLNRSQTENDGKDNREEQDNDDDTGLKMQRAPVCLICFTARLRVHQLQPQPYNEQHEKKAQETRQWHVS